MLPRRIPKAPKRASRWRSQAHCNFVRSHGCCVANCDQRPIDVAHVRRGSHAGMGQKPDDWHTISLCAFHHRAVQHHVGEASFERTYGLDMQSLAAEFATKSPKASEIRAIQRERGL